MVIWVSLNGFQLSTGLIVSIVISSVYLVSLCSRNENSMQWEHPELTAVYQATQNRYRNIKFASYRIALKLRSVQKKIQCKYILCNRMNLYICYCKHMSMINWLAFFKIHCRILTSCRTAV